MVSCVAYYTNKIADESSTDYFSHVQSRQLVLIILQILTNILKTFLLYLWSLCARLSPATERTNIYLSRKIFISFTIDGCSFIKLHCYECVSTASPDKGRWHFRIWAWQNRTDFGYQRRLKIEPIEPVFGCCNVVQLLNKVLVTEVFKLFLYHSLQLSTAYTLVSSKKSIRQHSLPFR